MQNILEKVKYNADGLVPAIAQDIRTDEVLMLAWMNEESLRKTIETGKAHYFSRSRQKLWLKGETSGHFQKVRSISIDCDADTLLLKVEQTGSACHTGHRSCFFTRLETDELKSGMDMRDAGMRERADAEEFSADGEKVAAACSESAEAGEKSTMTGAENTVSAGAESAAAGAKNAAPGSKGIAAGPEVLGEVFDVITDRKINPREGSYTNYLFTKGLDKILKKVGEEASEVVIASKNGDRKEISAEIADLIYHIMVLIAERGMTLTDIYEELNNRK